MSTTPVEPPPSQSARVMSGLEGVIACESAITFIDGAAGVLAYRGKDIHSIAERLSFEETVFLLWEGRLPDSGELASFRGELAARRSVAPPVLELLRAAPPYAHPMARLRTAVSLIGELDPDQEASGPAANRAKAMALTAQMATLVAAMARLAAGQEPVAPDPSLSHAANYLYMLTGERPAEQAVRAVDTTLVLYADHELNASTFTARCVVGTLADLYSAVVAAIGALKGPLHGGAIDDAIRTIKAIGSVEAVGPWLDQALAQKRRVAGFGHRVYKVVDPRAIHLQRMAEALARSHREPQWMEVARALQEELLQRKGLKANVDYYASLVLYYLGFPLDLFTTFIASSRVAGWCAHILEQYANNRLIRPRALYTGPAVELATG